MTMITLDLSHSPATHNLDYMEALAGQHVGCAIEVHTGVGPRGASGAPDGYFPAHIRMRPVPGSMPPRYEAAEVLDLQAVRDAARRRRT